MYLKIYDNSTILEVNGSTLVASYDFRNMNKNSFTFCLLNSHTFPIEIKEELN
jgi:hypothetical protein